MINRFWQRPSSPRVETIRKHVRLTLRFAKRSMIEKRETIYLEITRRYYTAYRTRRKRKYSAFQNTRVHLFQSADVFFLIIKIIIIMITNAIQRGEN